MKKIMFHWHFINTNSNIKNKTSLNVSPVYQVHDLHLLHCLCESLWSSAVRSEERRPENMESRRKKWKSLAQETGRRSGARCHTHCPWLSAPERSFLCPLTVSMFIHSSHSRLCRRCFRRVSCHCTMSFPNSNRKASDALMLLEDNPWHIPEHAFFSKQMALLLIWLCNREKWHEENVDFHTSQKTNRRRRYS